MFAVTHKEANTVERDGVKIAYKIFGDGPITMIFIPPWSIAGEDVWRMQIPYFSRYFKCITIDPRGNGETDRPEEVEKYSETEFAKDYMAVLDHAKIDKAVAVSFSWGANPMLWMLTTHSERFWGGFFCGPAVNLSEAYSGERSNILDPRSDQPEEWGKYNAEYWKDDYVGFLEWFKHKVYSDPHSSHALELFYTWAQDTDPDTLIKTVLGRQFTPKEVRRLAAKLTLPAFVVAGDEDQVVASDVIEEFAGLINADVLWLEGAGHAGYGRYPVPTNIALMDFIERIIPPSARKPKVRRVRRNMVRPKRILYLSSPVGLGHARRDASIARSLREVVPGVKIDWLSQPPTDKILEPLGEYLLPQCKNLISETAHFDAYSHDHCQPAVPILRSMDEIMINNFHVWREVVTENDYDLVVADESWEVDYFLYENPEYKPCPYVWATDVIGALPTARPGEVYNPKDPFAERYDYKYDAAMAHDYNQEMLSRIDRFPNVRDAAIFIGDKRDIPDLSFGDGLGGIREHAYKEYEFGGYVLGYDPREESKNRDEVRAEFGYRPDEKIVIACTGGMATGHNLLKKIVKSFRYAKEKVPELRLIVVAGPRIDPNSLYDGELPGGLEVKGFVNNLWRNMSVCDLAIVHGGLTMTMDLTAFGVPFISVPYVRQYEQEVWVRTRIENYGAGHYIDYRTLRGEDGPLILGNEIARKLGLGQQSYEPVVDSSLKIAKRLSEFL